VQRQLYDYLTIIITESHETVKLNRFNASLFTNGRVNIIYVCDTCQSVRLYRFAYNYIIVLWAITYIRVSTWYRVRWAKFKGSLFYIADNRDDPDHFLTVRLKPNTMFKYLLMYIFLFLKHNRMLNQIYSHRRPNMTC